MHFSGMDNRPTIRLCRQGRIVNRPCAGIVWTVWMAVFALALCGCYSFTGSGLPAGLRTVEIVPVTDQARQPELADQATKAIVDEFVRNGALRPVDRDAQSRLEASLSGYTHAPQTFDASGNVSRFRVTVNLDGKFTDQRDDAVLFDGKAIAGFHDYDPLTETEADAKSKALVVAVRKLVDNTISGW